AWACRRVKTAAAGPSAAAGPGAGPRHQSSLRTGHHEALEEYLWQRGYGRVIALEGQLRSVIERRGQGGSGSCPHVVPPRGAAPRPPPPPERACVGVGESGH